MALAGDRRTTVGGYSIEILFCAFRAENYISFTRGSGLFFDVGKVLLEENIVVFSDLAD